MSDAKRNTRLLRAGRPANGWVNVPPTRASTFVFETVEAWRDTRKRREKERLNSYGARGTDSTHALEDAVVELEAGHRRHSHISDDQLRFRPLKYIERLLAITCLRNLMTETGKYSLHRQ